MGVCIKFCRIFGNLLIFCEMVLFDIMIFLVVLVILVLVLFIVVINGLVMLSVCKSKNMVMEVNLVGSGLYFLLCIYI